MFLVCLLIILRRASFKVFQNLFYILSHGFQIGEASYALSLLAFN